MRLGRVRTIFFTLARSCLDIWDLGSSCLGITFYNGSCGEVSYHLLLYSHWSGQLYISHLGHLRLGSLLVMFLVYGFTNIFGPLLQLIDFLFLVWIKGFCQEPLVGCYFTQLGSLPFSQWLFIVYVVSLFGSFSWVFLPELRCGAFLSIAII